jgi:transposase
MEEPVQDLASLRLAVEALGPVRRGRPIPAELRLRLITAARDSLDAGLSKRAIAIGLGVTGETIRRWLGPAESHPAGARRQLRPVVVSDASGKATAAAALISPSGWRIEGLSLADIATLLERLR